MSQVIGGELMKKHFAYMLISFFGLASIFTGCGQEEAAATREEVLQYHIQEIQVPDPDQGLAAGQSDLWEYDYRLVEDTLYRIISVFDEEESRAKWYLQTLTEPYEAWERTEIDLADASMMGEESSIFDLQLTSGGLVAVSYGSGETAEAVAVWQDGDWFAEDILPKEAVSENLFSATREAIYQQEEEESIKLLTFRDYGVSLSEDPMIWAQSKEHIILAGNTINGRELLLIDSGEWEQAGEKQQITLAANITPFLQQVIVDFNRENTDYEVLLLNTAGETWSDLRLRFQAELAAGEGPDLIESSLIRLYSYARNGYLEPVDDWLQSRESGLLPQAVDSGKVDGHSYIVPYSFDIHSIVTTTEIADGRTRWTLDEMLEVMSVCQAEAFSMGAGGWDVLRSMVCYDEENTDFVDWDKGECYYDSEKFVSLLKYSKEWADDQQQLSSAELGREFREGHVMADVIYGGSSLQGYNQYLNQLGADCVYIGYPVESGNGTFIEGRGFAINSSSQCKDGAKAFLEYLISPEIQLEQWRQRKFMPVDQELIRQVLTEYAKELPYDEDNLASYDRPYNQEEAERYYQIIINSKTRGKRYEELITILYEETSGYYQGKRDPWEVARVVQNRAQLYLDETK